MVSIQRWGSVAGLVLVLALASVVQAQPPPADAASASSASASSATASSSGGASQAGGIVGLCQMIQAALAACKAKICACPLGQMITNTGSVLNTYGGGIFCPPCCPPINEADLAKASNTAQGACARIRKEEMELPARRDAVRCLAYANCCWWPEAEAALIVSLRTDRNECVRLEAARVMGTGCCCTRKVIEALTLTVTSSTADGNPPEISPRVKAEAYLSLQKCLQCFQEEVPAPKRPETPETPPLVPPERPVPTALRWAPGDIVPVSAQVMVQAAPVPPATPASPAVSSDAQTVEQARQALNVARPQLDESKLLPAGQRGLFQVIGYAWRTSRPTNPEAEAAAQAKVAAAFAPPPQTGEPPVSPQPAPRSSPGFFGGCSATLAPRLSAEAPSNRSRKRQRRKFACRR